MQHDRQCNKRHQQDLAETHEWDGVRVRGGAQKSTHCCLAKYRSLCIAEGRLETTHGRKIFGVCGVAVTVIFRPRTACCFIYF